MGQLLLELGNIPESLSSITRLHALDRQRLDPEVRSSILNDTFCRHRAPVGGNHVQPNTGADLQGADGAYLTWKYASGTDDISFLSPPTGGPVIVEATSILWKGFQF